MTSSYDVFQPAEYNPVSYEVPGSPKQAPDIASQITREYQLGEQRNAAYYKQFEINDSVLDANRKIENDKIEKQIKFQQEERQKLFAFSDKLMEMAAGAVKKQVTANQQRGAILQMNNGLTTEQMVNFQTQMAAAQELEGEEQVKAIEALNQTKNYNVSENIRTMGGSERIGYANQLMTQRKIDFKQTLPQQMASNNTLKLIDSAGATFTPATAGTAEQVKIASNAIFAEAISSYGIAGANPAFLEEMFIGGKDGARATLQEYNVKRTKEIQIDQSFNNKQNAVTRVADDLAAGKVANLNNLFLMNRSQLTNKGEIPTLKDSWEATGKDLERLVKSGQMSATEVVRQFQNNRDPMDPSKTWAENRPTLMKELVQKANKAQTDNYTQEKKMGEQEWDKMAVQLNDTMMDLISSGKPFTEGDYQAYQETLANIPGGKGMSTLLEKNYKNFSSQSINKKSNERLVLQKLADGTMTREELLTMGGDLFKQYVGQVENLEKARQAMGGDFKTIKTRIEATVRGVAKQLGKDDDLPWTAGLVSDHLYKQVLELGASYATLPKYQNNINGAYNAAMAQVMSDAKEQGLDPAAVDGLYADGLKGSFPNFTQQYFSGTKDASGNLVGGIAGDAAAVKERADKFSKDIKKYGTTAIDDPKLAEEEPYVSTADLTVNGDKYDAATWKPLPQVTELVRQDPTYDNALTVTNLLRKSRGLDELEPPPSLAPNNLNQTPEAKAALRALTLAQTPNQVYRGGSQMGVFDPNLVPNGYGPMYVASAKRSGFQPSLLAAIGSVESTQDHSAIRNNEDFGLMQINRYHIDNGLYTYDPKNPQANIDYATTVLTEMKSNAIAAGVLPQYQQDYMLAAYNGGLVTPDGAPYIPVVNGVPQFPPLAKDYLRKVKKELLRFGDRSQYSSSDVMRGKFAVMPANHPDTGQGYTIEGATDAHNRPVVLAQPALSALAQMVKDSGGRVKWSDIVSAQRSQAKNNSLLGASPTSNHLTGNAIDIHGASKAWIKANGSKYGWVNLVYDGHDGHFDFKP